MARINIEDSLFRDGRWMDLVGKAGGRWPALGMVVEAYIVAQEYFLNNETHGLIPVDAWKKRRAPDMVIEVGLAEIKDGFIYVAGSNTQFQWLLQKRVAGKKSAEMKKQQKIDEYEPTGVNECSTGVNGSQPLTLTLSLPPTLSLTQAPSEEALPDKSGTQQKKPRSKSQKSGEMPPTKETWESYRAAYFKRYGVDPIRNAKTSSQLKQFIDRVGAAEAPEIAAFYLLHNSQRYSLSAHSTGNLLFDAEKLRTEWARGRQITSAESRNIENKQQTVNAFSKHLSRGNS